MKTSDQAEALLTRRSWAAWIAATTVTTAAIPLTAQVPLTAPTASTAAASAADDVRKTSDQLAQIEVPMSLEPAFTFHA